MRNLDNEVLKAYISNYGKDLTRLCISLCQCRDDAEDLYQETWLKVIQKYHKYNPERPFDKWLFSVCVNTYKDNMRSAYRKKQLQFLTNDEKEQFINSIPVLQEKYEAHEDYKLLLDCLVKLPPKQKVAISLIYFKDYTEKDVADILGVPVGTVKSRLYNAKNRLKEMILNARKI